MNIEYRVGSRASVLRKLGLSNLVNSAKLDIAAAHEALVRRQAVPERIHADGLIVDVPAGVPQATSFTVTLQGDALILDS